MRRIEKGADPDCLQHLRGTPGADWSSVYGDQKQAMREQLLGEQLGLCAYCMSPIRADRKSMKVEHFETRAAAPGQIFDWQNLLGVCLGEVGIGHADGTGSYHCDTHRGHLPLEQQKLDVHPAKCPPDAGTQLSYTTKGEMRPALALVPPQSLHAQDTINRLNLNIDRLMRNRAGVLETLRATLKKKFTPASVEQLLAIARQSTNGCLQPYAQVAVAYLEKKQRQSRPPYGL